MMRKSCPVPIRLITRGSGVGVGGIGVGVGIGVDVGAGVGVTVGVGVGGSGVGVSVGIGVAVGAAVGSGIAVAVGTAVAVAGVAGAVGSLLVDSQPTATKHTSKTGITDQWNPSFVTEVPPRCMQTWASCDRSNRAAPIREETWVSPCLQKKEAQPMPSIVASVARSAYREVGRLSCHECAL